MAIQCVLVDPGLEVTGDDVEVRPVSSPLDLGGHAPHEVLVVSADAELLAEAGRLGVHRLLPTTPDATVAAVGELCRELDRA